MATFSGEEQLDLLIKKLFYGVAKGGSSDNYNFSNEVHDSFLAVKPSNIWTSAASIPSAPPSTTSSIVEVYTTNSGASQNAPLELTAVSLSGNAGTYSNFRKQWVALDSNSDRLKNWIGPGYGGAYAARVYVGQASWNGTDSDATAKGIQEISFGGNAAADWFFDYEAGVLFWTNENLGETGDFEGSADFTTDTGLIANGDKVYIKAYRYVGGTGLGSASNVTVADSNANTDFEVVFTTGASSDAALLVDSATPITYNPNTGTLTAQILSAAASLATTALVVNGNTTLGDAATDEISLTARFVSDLLPLADDTRDLGSASLKWAEVHATAFHGALTGNADTVTTNADLTGDVESSGNATIIADDAVTYAKMQNVATANRLLGSTSEDGIVAEVQVATDMIADDAVTADKLANVINSAITANANAAAAAQATANAALPSSGAAAALNIDHLITLTGVASASDHLGEFTGATINDDLTIKEALQALETKVEAVQTDVDTNESDADSAIAAVQSDVDANEAAADQAIADLLDGTTDFTAIDVNGGTIDGATIATSNITVGSGKTLNVSAGTLTLADNQISGDKVEGGTIDATTITTLTSSTIQATTLKANDGTAAGSIADSTGIVTLASSVLTTADINGGTIDATAIGATTPSTGAFTTITASGDVTVAGNLNVIGEGTYINLQQENVYMRDALITVGYVDDSDDDNFANGSAASSDVGIEAYKQGVSSSNPSLVYAISPNYWAIDNKDHGSSALTRVARTFKIQYTIDESSNNDVTNEYFTITHNLNHKDVIVQVRDASDNIVFFKYTSQTVNTVRVAIGGGIADSDIFNVVVVG